MVTILIYLSLTLIGLSMLMMVGFGFRALALGRKNYVAIGSMALALIVFLIAFTFVNPDAYPPIKSNAVTRTEAAIVLTAMAMFCLAILALFASAVRGLFR